MDYLQLSWSFAISSIRFHDRARHHILEARAAKFRGTRYVSANPMLRLFSIFPFLSSAAHLIQALIIRHLSEQLSFSLPSPILSTAIQAIFQNSDYHIPLNSKTFPLFIAPEEIPFPWHDIQNPSSPAASLAFPRYSPTPSTQDQPNQSLWHFCLVSA